MGLFAINFPQNSVCDPDQSNYTDWGQDCVALRGNIDVQVRLRVTASGIALDFSPEMRFAPSAGPVTISTDVFAPVLTGNKSFFAIHPASLNVLAMRYAPALGAAPIADYESDPSLITHVNLSTGRVWRVVRHFSGYLVGGGDAAVRSVAGRRPASRSTALASRSCSIDEKPRRFSPGLFAAPSRRSYARDARGHRCDVAHTAAGDRGRCHVALAPACSTYPTPRTVCSIGSSRSPSSFFRR